MYEGSWNNDNRHGHGLLQDKTGAEYLGEWVCVCERKRERERVHTSKNTYIHIHTHTYIHTYVYAYIHTHIHTYTHTHIHTYTRIRRWKASVKAAESNCGPQAQNSQKSAP